MTTNVAIVKSLSLLGLIDSKGDIGFWDPEVVVPHVKKGDLVIVVNISKGAPGSEWDEYHAVRVIHNGNLFWLCEDEIVLLEEEE